MRHAGFAFLVWAVLGCCLLAPGTAAAQGRYWILGIEEWNEVCAVKYDDDDTRMAQALAREGWDLYRLSDVGVVLERSSHPGEVRIISIDDWNRTARLEHQGSDTDMANALAREGWEITDMSRLGVVLKKNPRAPVVRLYDLDSWNRLASARYGGSDTRTLNALAAQGWELVQLSRYGVVLRRP